MEELIEYKGHQIVNFARGVWGVFETFDADPEPIFVAEPAGECAAAIDEVVAELDGEEVLT